MREMNLLGHLSDVALALMKNNGLDYNPRERTTQGRIFEHASDSRILIEHLVGVQSKNLPSFESIFYIRVVEEPSKDPKDEQEE